MSEETLKIVAEFTRLPSTPEKELINQQYLNDEIGMFDFFSKAKAYLEKQKLAGTSGS